MRSGMMQLGEIAKVSQHGANTNLMLPARDAQKLALAKREVEEMLEHWNCQCASHEITPTGKR
jgi:hypothetical protein